ncbi:YfhJ family protein [Evansella sp. AB-P1]|uniref:YfhJ family protein n=1 Tax=Evansella sp. AB-P1 TaxID=3037653 RepID=UPI00241C1087|nr:YfhJ family protein [Evansella sp. AB-P1]MDG5786238.1 YfhJ family protein [Evansella sp. AB-P1]
MNDYFERLTHRLLEQNENMSYSDARTWIELMWEDFETTYAKAGREYKGKEMTEKILVEWIDQYGSHLHEILLEKPKYKELFESKKFYH